MLESIRGVLEPDPPSYPEAVSADWARRFDKLAVEIGEQAPSFVDYSKLMAITKIEVSEISRDAVVASARFVEQEFRRERSVSRSRRAKIYSISLVLSLLGLLFLDRSPTLGAALMFTSALYLSNYFLAINLLNSTPAVASILRAMYFWVEFIPAAEPKDHPIYVNFDAIVEVVYQKAKNVFILRKLQNE